MKDNALILFSSFFYLVLFFDLFLILTSYTDIVNSSNKEERISFSHVSGFIYNEICWNIYSCRTESKLHNFYEKISKKWFTENAEKKILLFILIPVVFLITFITFGYFRKRTQSKKDKISLLSKVVFFCFIYLYFGNRLDSYQHRYLVCIILFYLTMLWNNEETTQFWSTCLQINIAIVYFWTFIVKLDYSFLSGEIFKHHINVFSANNQIYYDLIFLEDYIFSAASIFVVLIEFLLFILWGLDSITQLNNYSKYLMLFLATILHLPIAIMPYKIGLFSSYMAVIYFFKLMDLYFKKRKTENQSLTK